MNKHLNSCKCGFEDLTAVAVAERCLLGHSAVYTSRSPPVLKGNIFPSSPWSKSKRSKKQARSMYPGFFLGLLFNLEDGGITLF
jgi:hypothetical protein